MPPPARGADSVRAASNPEEGRMSKEELLTAYAEGSISRRMFVRRLVATGVTAGTAVSYAQLLAPPAEARPMRRGGGNVNDHYPLLTLKLLTRDLGDVVKHARMKVRATCGEGAYSQVAAFVKKGGDLLYIGS